MKTFEKLVLGAESLGMLQGLDEKGSRLTKAMTERQEYLERFQKFECAIKTLVPDDRQFLVNLLKTKLETACRSKVLAPLSALLALFSLSV